MPSAENIVKAAFTHGEGEDPLKREYGIRVRTKPNGKATVAVKRVAGTAAGKLTVYRASASDRDREKLESKSWLDESVNVVEDVTVTIPFLIVEAEFTDTNFGQIEVSIIS